MAKPSKYSTETPVLRRSVWLFVMLGRVGISQEALADLAQLDRSYMGGIERGEHNLSLINITKVAAALGISVAELMTQAKL